MSGRRQLSEVLFLMFVCLLGSSARAAPALTYHGRILNSDGTPEIAPSVAFKIQVRTPGTENCLLYEETQTKDLSSTAGVFVIGLNDGSGTRTDPSGYSINQIFSNLSSFSFGSGQCAVGNGYTPGPFDGRAMQIYFNDGTVQTWEALPLQAINYVPQAIDALEIGGFGSSSLVRVADSGVPGTATALTTPNFTELMNLIGGTSTQYVQSSAKGASLPVVNGVPTGPAVGQVWYNSASNSLQYENNSGPQTLGVSGAGISSLTVGANLTANSTAGGTLTGPGTIDLNTTGVASGVYTKVTVDTYGRVGAGTTLVEADIPTLSTAGKVVGSAINSGTIGGSAAINSSGNITTSGTVSASSVTTTNLSSRNLVIFDSGTHQLTLQTPTNLAASYSLTLPSGVPATSGYVLASDTSGNLSWVNPSTGSLTGLSVTAPITSTGSASSPNIGVNTATTSSSGVVTLAASGGTAAGTVIQATDSRLSDSRAPAGSASGDLSGTYPGPSVAKIQGTAVSSSAPTSAGEVLRYDGSTQYAAGFVGIADIRSTQAGNAAFFPTNCSSSQTLTYSAPSDTYVCTAISISGFSGSLSGDVMGPQTATVVATVGTSTASNIHAAEQLANAATSANTSSAIVRRDGSGNFSAGNVTENSSIFPDSGSNSVTLQAPTAVTSSYVLKLPTAVPSTAGYVLSSDTSGNLSWVNPSAGSVTSVSVTAPVTNSGSSSAPNIGMPAATSGQNGYLSSADWSTFNGKQSTSLASGDVWVGNTSGVATPVAVSGDLSLSSGGSSTVKRIQGTSVSSTAPTSAGQILRYDGSTQYAPSYIGVADIRSTVSGNAAFFPLTCSSSQTLVYTSVTDSMSCTNISVSSSQITGLGTAASQNVGTGSGNVVQLNSSSQIPAVDGSLVTNLNASSLASGTVASARLPSSATVWSVSGSNISYSAGSVGIGTSPGEVLDVQGNLRVKSGQLYTAAQVNTTSTATLTFDTNSGNIMVWSPTTTGSTATVNLYNVKSGGSYTLIVRDTATAALTFNCYAGSTSTPGTALTNSFMPASGARATNASFYSVISDGTYCYLIWMTGMT